MPVIVYQGNIDGEFKGFDDGMIFKLMNGTYYIQARYKCWHHDEHCPEATLIVENGQFMLTVSGMSIEVLPLQDVIKSQIDGIFEGWQGSSQYKLTNGQVWQQSTNKHQYRYADKPETVIYKSNDGYRMIVAGINIQVKRIK